MSLDMERRTFAAPGAGALLFVFANDAHGQEAVRPTPEHLARALPSTGPVFQAGTPPPELPPPQPAGVSERLLPGFRLQIYQTRGARIRVLSKGQGKPLLLVHGHPETHVAWHKVAPRMVEAGCRVILPDLRGYGDSSKPGYSPESRVYSFRAMAQDMVDVMAALGHDRFLAAGHDRGGRVLHRFCLDHPEAVERTAVLDIAPTLTMDDDTSKEFATKYVWWFLQIQPAPMPEHIISRDPAYYLRDHLAVRGKTPAAVTPEALAEYIRAIAARARSTRFARTIALPPGSTSTWTGRMTRRVTISMFPCSLYGARKAPSASSGLCRPLGAPSPPLRSRATHCRTATCCPKNNRTSSSRTSSTFSRPRWQQVVGSSAATTGAR